MKARKVKKLDPARSLDENAARIVQIRLGEMESFVPAALDAANTTEQHDMRIAAKRLRYILEATGFCFGTAGGNARRRARELQEILGELHDCDVMLPKVEAHIDELRSADAAAVHQSAGEAEDLDPALAARAPHRTSYRGLEGLAVYVQARRRLLFERFLAFWSEQEQAGTWKRLERSVDRTLDDARERRDAAERAERAAAELAAAEQAERDAAARAREAAERLRVTQSESSGLSSG